MASSSQVSEDSLSNNDSSSSHPPTPAEECSAKKISRKGGKELPRRRIGPKILYRGTLYNIFDWTKEEIETLITLWEGNEILYSVSS